MWSHDGRLTWRAGRRAAAALALATMLAGCFQPMYGERSLTGAPSPMRAALAGVEVQQIAGLPAQASGRLAVELRNELNYALTGGSSPLPATHRLQITLATSSQQLIVDPTTARGEFEVVSVNATYTLTDVRTSKQVLIGAAAARTSFDVPGQQQRYGAIAGQRDAQSRAAQVIAEQIRNRLASHFAAGT